MDQSGLKTRIKNMGLGPFHCRAHRSRNIHAVLSGTTTVAICKIQDVAELICSMLNADSSEPGIEYSFHLESNLDSVEKQKK